jgi:hypothetical protein
MKKVDEIVTKYQYDIKNLKEIFSLWMCQSKWNIQSIPANKDTIALIVQRGKVFAQFLEWSMQCWKIPMLPRHTQVLVVQVVTEWAKTMFGIPEGHKSRQKIMLAQVRPSEGRSLTIVMTAAVFVKTFSKKVHILYTSLNILTRDFEMYKQYFEMLGIKTTKNVFSHDASIVFCLRDALDKYYVDNAYAGNRPLNNTILLMSNARGIFVDRNPHKSFDKKDNTTDIVMTYFRLLMNPRNNAHNLDVSPPDNVDQEMWCLAVQAKFMSESIRPNEPNGYMLSGKVYKPLDENGIPNMSIYSLGHEYLKYKFLRKQPNIRTDFFYRSTPHLLLQYELTISLTSSLGSSAERDFISKMYNAFIFEVPSYLESLEVEEPIKQPLQLFTLHEDECVFIENNEQDQWFKLVDMIKHYFLQVPVVVIMPTVDDVDNFYEVLYTELEAMQMPDISLNEIQKFVALDETTGKPMDYRLLTKLTTSKPKPGFKNWMVTITDEWGSVQNDYRISNKDVDNAGGIVVIATYIPKTPRMWDKWLMQPLRGDMKSQYAVVLNREDPFLAPNYRVIDQHPFMGDNTLQPDGYSPTVIPALFDIQNVDESSSLEMLSDSIIQGQQLNELCEVFFRRYPGTSELWPGKPEHKQLRDFLQEVENHNTQGIAEFAVRLRLAENVDAYMSRSKYVTFEDESNPQSNERK